MDRLLKAKYRKGLDPREQPVYTIAEAARYLGINSQTLTTWLVGRPYETKAGRRTWQPVIKPADEKLRLLSFYNLAEAHVLAATRYEHEIPFWAVREAIKTIVKQYPKSRKHPLLADDFLTQGKEIFVKRVNELLNLSSPQLSLAIMDSFLVRVLRDDDRNPFKVFPLRKGEEDDKVVSIVAGVASSRPIIDSTGTPVLAVWRRFKAGEDPKYIAEDFEVEISQVERAISYFERRAA
ncbi:MAG: DUF433 domain-containing protein [Acidobacteriaceae bacterium]